MERNIFAFIWKYSKRDQLLLLGLTLVTFPFLYATLELPKRIINDAIEAPTQTVPVLGFELSQVQFLLILSFGYLAAVTIHGLLKMRLNTMKGVVAERLLRRFRYSLLARMMRFPSSYFRNTSQGEMVSMVTSEAEPMGGLMGDAVAQPVFQAGQMLIILVFLFLQSVWFGLAGVALIPLQAWLIPMIQRQINLLNKARVQQIRAFSSEIGESVAGLADLRANGGVRFRLAVISARLAQLFDIRFQIYQKKFFMKFLNNFITQLTPFFFYSVGGVLAIRGDITVGALVAALAAYKDLSAPWKELLTYYNQVQDMDLRWQVVTERFDPPGMISRELFEGEPTEVPHLRGPIEMQNVTLRSGEGRPVLDGLTLSIPHRARVAIKVQNQTEREALATLLTREAVPQRGSIRIAGHDLFGLHQSVIAARVGYAGSKPYFFEGTLGQNLLMPLMTSPRTVPWDPRQRDRRLIEAEKTGNSVDNPASDWVDPGLAGLSDGDDIREWWFSLVQAMGVDQAMVRGLLGSVMNPENHEALARAIIDMRPQIADDLTESGLDRYVYRFDPDAFNPAMPMGGNLMFAAPRRVISAQELVANTALFAIMAETGVTGPALAISQTLIETLHQIFGMDGTEHPLFMSLDIKVDEYERLVRIADARRTNGDGALSDDDFATLLTVPFRFTAEQIGPDFPDSFKNELLEIRQRYGARIREAVSDQFIPITPENYLPRLSIQNNALYGLVSSEAGSNADKIRDLVLARIDEHGLRRRVAETVFDLPTELGGVNLAANIQERVAFSRAAMKRPDILILDRALASHSTESRRKTRTAMAELLPDTTLLFMEENFANPENYDLFVEIKDGRIDGLQRQDEIEDDSVGSEDLRRKLEAISGAEPFAPLDLRSRRLLAFAARWYEARPGERIFSRGDPPDAVYLCTAGRAQLILPNADGNEAERVISTVVPGRLIGDLSVLIDEDRTLHLQALEDVTFLRIGARQFMDVISSDKSVLLSLLRTVSQNLKDSGENFRDIARELIEGKSETAP